MSTINNDTLEAADSANSSSSDCRSRTIVAAAASSAVLLGVAAYFGSAATATNDSGASNSTPSLRSTHRKLETTTATRNVVSQSTPSLRPRKLETATTSSTTTSTAVPAAPPITPFFGDALVQFPEIGIEVSEGLDVKLIATTGQPVQYADGTNSTLAYHAQSDAAGVISLNPDNPHEGGYVLVSNSELGNGEGGVYGMYFSKDGDLMEYKVLLPGTTDNCGGGLTPWHTWLSCEEFEDGQCWQVDPNPNNPNHATPAATVLGGKGGRYESVAVDNRNPTLPVFFTTEDHSEGALRRFVADGAGWDALHTDGAEKEMFLNIKDETTFEWTKDEKKARKSAAEFYPNTEGIQFHEGKLYMMAKKIATMFVLNLEDETYVAETTGLKFYGEGSFDNQPDQNLFGPTRKWMYFTEDGGSSPGVYARHDEHGAYFTVFQALEGGIHDGDETIGVALSPDSRTLYAGHQDLGMIYAFTRKDGFPFE
ncbi:hypothetical protein ACHAXT_001728 [Thalassiosira profunda]